MKLTHWLYKVENVGAPDQFTKPPLSNFRRKQIPRKMKQDKWLPWRVKSLKACLRSHRSSLSSPHLLNLIQNSLSFFWGKSTGLRQPFDWLIDWLIVWLFFYTRFCFSVHKVSHIIVNIKSFPRLIHSFYLPVLKYMYTKYIHFKYVTCITQWRQKRIFNKISMALCWSGISFRQTTYLAMNHTYTLVVHSQRKASTWLLRHWN